MFNLHIVVFFILAFASKASAQDSSRSPRIARCAFYLSPLILLSFLLAFYGMNNPFSYITRYQPGVTRYVLAGHNHSKQLSVTFTKNMAEVAVPEVSRANTSFPSFPAALAARASSNKDIILSLMDMATFPMAVNFWETSLIAYHIENYLFVSSNEKACNMLIDIGIPCYFYMEDKAGEKKSIYMSADFKRKMNIRTFMILEALLLGYNVLHTDLDVIWFRNPLPDIGCMTNCDVAALWDCGAMNAGFVYVRPTPRGIDVYKHMNKTAATTSRDDQTAFNSALGAGKNKGLKVLRLPGDKYQCGMRYWEQEHRTFAGDNPCKKCVVAHNNWIVSVEAKTYRFKEMHYWLYDMDGYYSNTEEKYIIYANPYDAKDDKTKIAELEALKIALAIGKLLNRVVLLPAFHCGKPEKRRLCDIINFIKIRELDKVFPRKYREHTFLTHPKVPEEVKQSQTKLHLIKTETLGTFEHVPVSEVDLQIFIPKNATRGATGQEILAQYGNIKESVLNFHSLYGAIDYKNDPLLGKEFVDLLKKALIKGAYRQF